jgi:shikimate kinase
METDSLNVQPVVFIGPIKTGKSTVGRLLAERLGCDFKSLDRWERTYTQAAGFNPRVATELRNREGILAAYDYRRGFFDEAVVGFLVRHTDGVLELGGGHPILADAKKQARVNQALGPIPNVVLLMPTRNVQQSIAILKSRRKPESSSPDFNEIFLADTRFFDLAKFVIYTEGKSAEQTCQEVIRAIGQGSK